MAGIIDKVGRRAVSDWIVIQEEGLNPVVIDFAVSPSEVHTCVQAAEVIILLGVSRFYQ